MKFNNSKQYQAAQDLRTAKNQLKNKYYIFSIYEDNGIFKPALIASGDDPQTLKKMAVEFVKAVKNYEQDFKLNNPDEIYFRSAEAIRENFNNIYNKLVNEEQHGRYCLPSTEQPRTIAEKYNLTPVEFPLDIFTGSFTNIQDAINEFDEILPKIKNPNTRLDVAVSFSKVINTLHKQYETFKKGGK